MRRWNLDENGDFNNTNILCTIEFSTGYQVPIREEKDIEHLTNALIGEIFIPAIKEGNINYASQEVLAEIERIIENMEEDDVRTKFLQILLYETFRKGLNKIDELAKKEDDKD